MENLLRTLVKTDVKPIQAIASESGLHPNTVTKLIKPDGLVLRDQRQLDSIRKLAAHYGLDVEWQIKLVPKPEALNG